MKIGLFDYFDEFFFGLLSIIDYRKISIYPCDNDLTKNLRIFENITVNIHSKLQ
jgi:hypothetical protein